MTRDRFTFIFFKNLVIVKFPLLLVLSGPLDNTLYMCYQMPKTVEELDAAIQDNISQANAILFLNHNILEEYEHLHRQVTFLHILFDLLVVT